LQNAQCLPPSPAYYHVPTGSLAAHPPLIGSQNHDKVSKKAARSGGLMMAKTMKCLSALSLLMTVGFCLLYQLTANKVLFTLAITCGTIFYHFAVRLLVGAVFDMIMQNKADYTKKWFQVSQSEMKLYQALKVKRWKNKMPTYDMDVFDVSKHSWEEILQATCQSELVHEANVILSFLPLAASAWFGSLGAFLITSLLSAVFDLMFVFMQRYNRSRILKVKKRSHRFVCRVSGR
jgi:hypothetical protein